MDFYQFHCATRVVFNNGLSKDFAAELALYNPPSLFVITDKVLFDLKIVDPILQGVKNAGIEIAGVFSEVPSNSELRVVKSCAEKAIATGADGILAIGGGSVIDTAKAVNILLTHGGDLVGDYSGAQTIPNPLKTLIAIPTTAGTGSEVSTAAVILDESTHTKLSFVDRYLAPHLAILDPEITTSMPPKLTAATAMDALTHAIESYTSPQASPVSRSFSAAAIPLIRENLLKAILHGDDLEARGALLTAATMAGIAFDHAMVGVVHGMAHATGGLANVHHGTANSIFLPWGMEYNLEFCYPRYAEIAEFLGVRRPKMGEREAARAAIEAIKRFRLELHQACGLPSCLKEVGVEEGLLEKIAEGAVNDGTSFYNPREVIKEEVLEFIKKAY
ncbi:MAG: iron-containing alcohol dehydrogenase [Deltaproteobacteria bacterium]|nr:iron-containing alcohol dehydrogenase [Deltaproteobacteria bacterium]